MAILVIGCTLLRVREHLVGFFAFFEFDLGFFGRIALVAVGVVLHRQFAISLFDLIFAGVFRDTQNFVKVAFSSHGGLLFYMYQRRADPCGAGARRTELKSFSLF